jgi:hypothetical protein
MPILPPIPAEKSCVRVSRLSTDAPRRRLPDNKASICPEVLWTDDGQRGKVRYPSMEYSPLLAYFHLYHNIKTCQMQSILKYLI